MLLTKIPISLFFQVSKLTQASRRQRVKGQRGELQPQRPHQRVGQTQGEQQGDRKRQRATASSAEEEEEKFETAETKDKTLKKSILVNFKDKQIF